MSLAEPRRKVRIGPNPRGKFFQEEDENRGRQMLLKRGWKTGDGLGANCTGMSEPIKPKVNTESRGLGFDRKQDPWVAHNEEFEQLLKNLNSNSSDEDRQEKGDAAADEISGSTKHALEKKSKGSRSRIHYHKFVKNKDLSKASFKDMSCIFGKSLDVTVSLLTTKVVDSPESSDESKLNGESSEVVTEITDINDTPTVEPQEESKKRKKKKKNKEQQDSSSSSPTEEESIQVDNIMEEAVDLESDKTERKKKKKKRKQKDLEDEPIVENNPNHDNDNNETEELQAESINEKDAMDQDEPENEIKKKKKKSKKRKREDEEEVHQNISEVEPEPTPSSAENADPEEPEIKKKKKKKSKKSRRDEDEVLEEVANVVPDNRVESDLSAPPQKEEEPQNNPIPPENVEKLGNMQFINRGSIVDYFRNKMLNRNRAAQNIA